MARPKKMTPAYLRELVDKYFEELGTTTFPDYAGMLLKLDLYPDDVAALTDEDNPQSAEYRRVFEHAELRRESWLSRVAASDSKLASGAFNLLKQQKNGGYTTVSAPNKGSTLRVIVDGVGGMDAFK